MKRKLDGVKVEYLELDLPIESRASQNAKILAHLKSGKGLTAMHALKSFGCFRLSARIHELAASHPIRSTMIRAGKKRIAYYQLEGTV